MSREPEVRAGTVLCSSLRGAGLHRMAYRDWGARDNPEVLVCVHGLTRVGRDFDQLARQLAKDYRVVCPDIAGRGKSDWLRNKKDYRFEQYVADMLTLIARLDVSEVNWLGTSMGGMTGLLLASQEKSPIKRLMLNDIGPQMSRQGLRDIVTYLGMDPLFASFDAAVAYVRSVSLPFGPHSDIQWRELTEYCVAQRADGRWGFVYDPGLSQMSGAFQRRIVRFLLHFFPASHPLLNQWPAYERITCPTLVMRGAESKMLSRANWQRMGECGPRAKLVEIPGVGHAPTFLHDENINIVTDFLKSA